MGAVAVYGEGSSACDNYSPDGDACDESWSLNEYGRIYNWYAVDDTRGLCPSGWHVPTDGEWTVMTDGLGGESVAGGQMKQNMDGMLTTAQIRAGFQGCRAAFVSTWGFSSVRAFSEAIGVLRPMAQRFVPLPGRRQ